MSRHPDMSDPHAMSIATAIRRARNPRVYDVNAIRSQAVVPRPTSDRALIERLRTDPALHFEDAPPARRLPRGVLP